MIGPANQMMVEPTQNNIDQLCELGIPAEQARRYLRVKSNNLEAAVNAIFEGENIADLEKEDTWDESAWSTDREGNAQQNLAPLGAPTRRPSPAPSLGLQRPTNQAAEDDELARALLLSKGQTEQPVAFQQETGVRRQDGTEQVHFGPATKNHYDEQQWGLTVAHEVLPDVPAKQRKHVEFEPRILKPFPPTDADYLPNLLTICHAIPKTRLALLMPQCSKDDYAYDADWWRGHPIAVPRIVHTNDSTPADPNADKYNELIMEVQRIMAFLDGGERSYISIGALTQTEMIRDAGSSSRAGSLLELFLQNWIIAAMSKFESPHGKKQVQDVFNTVVGTTDRLGMDTPNLTVIDMSVKSLEGQRPDLFELMDNHLWDTDDDSNMADNYIERPADVLVVRLKRNDSAASELGVEVPAAFHLDKYLKENVDASRATRKKMAQGRKRVAKIEEIENKLRYMQHPTKSIRLDAGRLLNHTLGHFSGRNRRDADDANAGNSASVVDQTRPGSAEIAAKLERVIESVDEKLKLLAEEREKICRVISDLSKAPLAGKEESQLEHRYTLRGVATKPNITYVLQRRDDADIAPQPEEGTAPEGFEWWRVQYEVSGQGAQTMATRTADYDVLRAVELEHDSAMLVYASDETIDYPRDGISQALQEFINRDNNALQEELVKAEEEAGPPAYDLNDYNIPRTSIERKDSMSSLAPMDYTQHHAFGLGYDVKASAPDTDDNVHEIYLDNESDPISGSSPSTREMEMVEKAHQPLVAGPADQVDVAMSGVGSDSASHVEDADTRNETF